METVTTLDWIERCAQRIAQIDPRMDEWQAKDLARDIHDFERTAAMVPEEAAEFVAAELARSAPRFERRTLPRA